MQAGIRTETVTTAQRFETLRRSWNDLAARAPVNGVFSSWDWLHAWWETFARPPLQIGLFWRADGALAGVAPLYRASERRRGVLAGQVLRLLGDDEVASDDLDLIVDPRHEDEVLGAMKRWLADQRWDQLLLCHLDARGGAVDRLLEGHARGARPTALDRALRLEAYRFPCPRILLPETVQGWQATLSANRRATLARKQRRLEETGARIVCLGGAEAATRGLDALFSLHRRRWAAMGRAALDNLHRPEVESFHRRAARDLAERGALRCFLLDHPEGPLAVLYGFVDRGSFYFFQMGHAPEVDRLSPGAVVMAASVRGAIEQGCRAYEMLRGDDEYKSHWQNETRFVRTLRVSAPGRPRGAALLVAERCHRSMVGALRRWREHAGE